MALSLLANNAMGHVLRINVDTDMLESSVAVDQTPNTENDPLYIFEIVKNCSDYTCKPCCTCVIDPDGYMRAVCSGSGCSKTKNERCQKERACKCEEKKKKPSAFVVEDL